MADDLRQQQMDQLALNRFWNELVRPTGEPAPEPTGDLREQTETVRLLCQLAKTAPPDRVRERVHRGLIDAAVLPDNAQPNGGIRVAPSPPRLPGGSTQVPADLNGRYPSTPRRHEPAE